MSHNRGRKQARRVFGCQSLLSWPCWCNRFNATQKSLTRARHSRERQIREACCYQIRAKKKKNKEGLKKVHRNPGLTRDVPEIRIVHERSSTRSWVKSNPRMMRWYSLKKLDGTRPNNKLTCTQTKKTQANSRLEASASSDSLGVLSKGNGEFWKNIWSPRGSTGDWGCIRGVYPPGRFPGRVQKNGRCPALLDWARRIGALVREKYWLCTETPPGKLTRLVSQVVLFKRAVWPSLGTPKVPGLIPSTGSDESSRSGFYNRSITRMEGNLALPRLARLPSECHGPDYSLELLNGAG